MDDFKQIVSIQKAYFNSGATRSYEFRIDALDKLKNAVITHEADINEALMSDLHKAEFETYLCEIGMVLEEISTLKKGLKKWMKNKRVKAPLSQFKSKCFISPEPLGCVYIMSPWNYPFHLCILPLAGAIAAGNCAVVKPSSQAPATSHLIAKLLGDIFPQEFIAVAEGDRSESQWLLDEPFDLIFFTGNESGGKEVMQKAAAHLTPVVLELGGKSPIIVDETADIKLAARRIAFGKVLNAGQTCVEPDYLLLQRSKKDEFVAAYNEALDMFFPKGNMDDMTHIISPAKFARAKSLLEGQKVLIGGECDEENLFISPTLLDETDSESPILKQEIFAPILPMVCFDTISEVIEYIQQRPKPLALYLFSTSKAVQDRILESCSFGGGCINDTIIHLACNELPFGGVGASGMGSYHGKKSFETFSHMRSVVNKSNKIDIKMRYFPYRKSKLSLVKKFLK